MIVQDLIEPWKSQLETLLYKNLDCRKRLGMSGRVAKWLGYLPETGVTIWIAGRILNTSHGLQVEGQGLEDHIVEVRYYKDREKVGRWILFRIVSRAKGGCNDFVKQMLRVVIRQ